jgi:hypothetical protein
MSTVNNLMMSGTKTVVDSKVSISRVITLKDVVSLVDVYINNDGSCVRIHSITLKNHNLSVYNYLDPSNCS